MMFKNSLSRKRNSHHPITSPLKLGMIITVSIALTSCSGSKSTVATTKATTVEQQQQLATSRPVSRNTSRNNKERTETEITPEESQVEEASAESNVLEIAIKTALEYEGTRYQYGGSSSKGMDCSGLVHISFAEAGEKVPRSSMDFFNKANPIDVKEVRRGDLMFFATGRDRKRINHVALVIEVNPAEIRFVHATVSRGVIVSSFNEAYWIEKYRSSGRLF